MKRYVHGPTAVELPVVVNLDRLKNGTAGKPAGYEKSPRDNRGLFGWLVVSLWE